MKDSRTTKEELEAKVEMAKIKMAIWIAVFGCAILVAGIALPPLGVIDNSILIASGEIFIFSASIMGIKLSYEFKLKELAAKMRQHEIEKEDPGNS